MRSRQRVGVRWALVVLAGGCGNAETITPSLPDPGVEAPAGDEQGSPAAAEPGEASPLASETCGSDGVARTYLVSIETQADADALDGCHTVDGDLNLRVFAGLDTTPLLALERVTGSLAIVGTGDDDPHALDGLSQLESVGELSLSNVRLDDLSAFGRLRAIHPGPSGPTGAAPANAEGHLDINDCEGLTSLAGFGALEQVDRVHLSGLTGLTQLTGLDSLRTLLELQVHGSPLEDLNGLAGVQLDALSLVSSQIRDLSGLHLQGTDTTSQLELRDNHALVSLAGWQPPPHVFEIILSGNGALTDLHGLEPIETLTFATIENEASLTSLEGVTGLRSVGRLQVFGNPLLPSLAGLNGVIGLGEVTIGGNPNLADLAGLAPDAEITSLQLTGLPALNDLSGIGTARLGRLAIDTMSLVDLRGLEQATLSDGLVLSGMPALTSLDGLPVGSQSLEIEIADCPLFVDLDALGTVEALKALRLTRTGVQNLDRLASLRRVEALLLDGNASLEQVDGLAALEQLGYLDVYDNPALRALPAFASLIVPCTDCEWVPSIDVRHNAALEDLGSWPSLDQLLALTVDDNPSLRGISFPALTSVQLVSISNNAQLGAIELPSLLRARSLIVHGNGVLDDGELALPALAELGSVKIVSNLGGPARLTPCPWSGDGTCDEAGEDCAIGTDVGDCGTP